MRVSSEHLGGLASALALSVAWSGFAAADTSRADVVAYLRNFGSAGEQLATVIDATVFPARPVRATDDWPRQGWDESAAVKSTYRWIYGRRRLRIERLAPEGAWPSCCGSEHASSTWLWTGSVSYTLLYDAHHERREVQIKPEHKVAPSLECFPVWNGGVEAVSLVGFDSLATIAEDYTLLELDGDDDHLWVTFDLGISRTMELTMRFDKHQGLELRELDVRFFSRSADGVDWSLSMRKTVTLDAWRDFDGRRLPGRATVIACNFRSLQPGGSKAFRTTYVRRAVEAFQAERAFDPSMAIMEDDVVRDATLRIAYTIGKNEIHVDGHRYRRQDPIDAIIVGELPAFIEGAEFAGAARRAGGLFASRRAVDLEHEGSDAFVLVFKGDEAPPQPMVEGPPSVRIETSGWTRVRPSSRKTEGRWEMKIRLEAETDVLVGDVLTVRLGDHLAMVDLTGRPWRAAWAEGQAIEEAKTRDEDESEGENES